MPSKCGIFICEEWRLAYSKEALILEKSNLESENSSNGFTEGTEKKNSFEIRRQCQSHNHVPQ